MFEVGDIIIGNEKNTYNITGRGVKCKVIDTDLEGKSNESDSEEKYPSVIEKRNILVEVLDGRRKGRRHWVDKDLFNLVGKRKRNNLSW